ncbi:LOW QUALITY PROTEIN: molybdopterin biosynthesis protein MoeB [Bacillus sp. JCM 19046]|nr:LOW QUALITY PROTEIN: molybdopterin biosynthesis protein MoeB [Bacillus sp. JCM 19045]GAF19378.1 LOW QUALITY PROTEIN: molybdopterin biosynthesis protein MoeB [Bacillus sp. JCM 19046]
MHRFERYSRQLLFPGIGEAGQERLVNSKVLIVGVGALGTVIANHLSRSGVGLIRLVDRDYVEMSNLQRQMLFTEKDVEQLLPKAIAAKQALRNINSSIEVQAFVEDVTVQNIEQLMDGIDVVVDGTDNFQTRFLLNDACFKKGIPFSYGGAVSARGMNAFLVPGKTPCFRCFIESGGSTGETCDTVGVLSPVVDMVASMQAMETIKYLVGAFEKNRRSLSTFDSWSNYRHDIQFQRAKPECPTCQTKEYPSLRVQKEAEVTLCGRNTIQISANQPLELDLIAERLNKVAEIKKTPFLIRARLNEEETVVVFPDGRILVQGTEDLGRARSIFSKYIGN